MDEDGRSLWDSLSFLQKMRVGEDMLEELADKLGLRELFDIPVIALSNGQGRRARIARAVMLAPDLLLLHESLSECSSFLHLFPSSIPRNFPIPNLLSFIFRDCRVFALAYPRFPLPTSFLS